MRNLRIKIKENLSLNLNSDIDYLSIKSKHTNRVPYDISCMTEINTNRTIINELIHNHSNYENIMWNFWKQDKNTCIKEMTKLLVQISKLDKMLSWDCQDTIAKYENNYDIKHKKALLVESDSHTHDVEERSINIEIPTELIKLSAADNLVMDAGDAYKLKSVIEEFKNECKQLVKLCDFLSDNNISHDTYVGKF